MAQWIQQNAGIIILFTVAAVFVRWAIAGAIRDAHRDLFRK